MDINAVTSDLLFDNCSIRKMEIVNDAISLTMSEKMTLGLGAETEYLGVSNDRHHAVVTMQIDVEAVRESDKSTSFIKTTIEGRFSADSSLDQDDFYKKATLNGSAALYSVARGKIDAITGAVFANGKIDIPFVNFIEYYKESSKNE